MASTIDAAAAAGTGVSLAGAASRTPWVAPWRGLFVKPGAAAASAAAGAGAAALAIPPSRQTVPLPGLVSAAGVGPVDTADSDDEAEVAPASLGGASTSARAREQSRCKARVAEEGEALRTSRAFELGVLG